jgi:hypothetical protein
MSEHPWDAEVEAESAYAVYDSKTGRVVHIHRLTVHRGADAPSAAESATQALELARRHGHEGDLETVEISPADLQGHAPEHVDLATGEIKPDTAY